MPPEGIPSRDENAAVGATGDLHHHFDMSACGLRQLVQVAQWDERIQIPMCQKKGAGQARC